MFAFGCRCVLTVQVCSGNGMAKMGGKSCVALQDSHEIWHRCLPWGVRCEMTKVDMVILWQKLGENLVTIQFFHQFMKFAQIMGVDVQVYTW